MDLQVDKSPVLAADLARDLRICGRSLQGADTSRFTAEGAHEPTPTPYFVLETLFQKLQFTAESHLLDVGCGLGRTLAYFADAGLSGRATGIELDPVLAAEAATWATNHPQLAVFSGDVLAADLSPYTHFYLFNPFDSSVLQRFFG